MIKLFYFLLCFLMCFFGVILSIHFNLWIGLSITILFGIKFILLIPNTKKCGLDRLNK
jgi:ABC-type Mn2+/Zn2+ transport system permease subunit